MAVGDQGLSGKGGQGPRPGKWLAAMWHGGPVASFRYFTLRQSGAFDGAWYLRRYPDVAASKMNPLRHYVTHGAAEGRAMREDMEIPRIIFQTWKSKTEIPEDFARWRTSFARHNPDYDHPLWTDAENRDFAAKHFPFLLEMYDRYPREIYRVDLVRYMFLYMHGGFYADMDTECLKPLDHYRNHHGVILGQMGSNPDFRQALPNAIMAASPRQRFWLTVLALAEETRKADPDCKGTPEEMTGPVLLTRAARLYAHKPAQAAALAERVSRRLAAPLRKSISGALKILPPREWYPISWHDRIHTRLRNEVKAGTVLTEEEKKFLFPDASMVTYWSHSW